MIIEGFNHKRGEFIHQSLHFALYPVMIAFIYSHDQITASLVETNTDPLMLMVIILVPQSPADYGLD